MGLLNIGFFLDWFSWSNGKVDTSLCFNCKFCNLDKWFSNYRLQKLKMFKEGFFIVTFVFSYNDWRVKENCFKSRKECILSGINFLADVKTTHFLFIDDVIFFGLDKLKYWEDFHSILDFFVMQHVWKSMMINIAYIPIGFRQISCLKWKKTFSV